MKKLLETVFTGNGVFILDGAMGTMLQQSGKIPGHFPEEVNITSPETVLEIHHKYIEAGATIIETNSFGGNKLKLMPAFTEAQVHGINRCAAEIAAKAAGDKALVAGSIGPTGKFLYPEGDLLFDDAVRIFETQARSLAEGGADIILIETMFDLAEAKAAVIGARRVGIPVWAQMTFEKNLRTLTGTTPEVAAITLASAGASIVGSNCGLGPELMLEVAERMAKVSPCRVAAVSNAGLPQIIDGKTVFPMSPEEMAGYTQKLIDAGASIIGGCCGTTPEHIAKISESLKSATIPERKFSHRRYLCSRTEYFEVGAAPRIIGERINPTGKKKLSADIKEKKYIRVRETAIEQENSGAACLDVNVGVPGINEAEILPEAVSVVQGAVSVPLVIDSSYPEAIESALKICDGRPLINSVNGKESSIHTILPLAAQYGAMVIGLLVDEDGIPATVEKRIEIARKILKFARTYGLNEDDLVFDCLTLAASAEPHGPMTGIETIRRITAELGCNTVMGVSNVSFGLPSRESVNAAFLSMVLAAGCSLVIINPSNAEMMKSFYSSLLLCGHDHDAAQFIEFQNTIVPEEHAKNAVKKTAISSKKDDLSGFHPIMRGVIEGINVNEMALSALNENTALEIINTMLVPGINVVGEKYDKGEYFLPQLIRSAKVMGAACDALRPHMDKTKTEKLGRILLATVEGDVHDIGKNIVGTLLANYGFDVIDLGKDVKTDVIIREAAEKKPDLVGLSALMTTTMMEMKKVIDRLRAEGISSKVIIGGAVCTEEFKNSIGADYYAADAVEAVKKAREAVGVKA